MVAVYKHLLSAEGETVSIKKDKVPIVTTLICYLENMKINKVECDKNSVRQVGAHNTLLNKNKYLDNICMIIPSSFIGNYIFKKDNTNVLSNR